MADKKLSWCDYEVADGPHGRYILQNGEFRGHAASVAARDGISFSQQGKDAVLWLVREGQPPRAMATRAQGRIGTVAIEVNFESLTGVRITKDDRFLRPGDGFVILPLGANCEPGPLDMEEGRPRPTFYLPEAASE